MTHPQIENPPRPDLQVPKSVVIIGAGISGLTSAHLLKKRGVTVTVLEQSAGAGGTMRTIREQGWLIESGPNSALETTPLFHQMFEDLGISTARMYAKETSDRRYIVRRGELHALPMRPAAFLASRLWTLPGKLRLLGEPFVGRAEKEESVAEFVERRLGREFLDYAVDPFVAGVFAGDPARLSVQSAFPKLYALESKYGSLVNGAIRSRRERKKRREIAKDRARMFSFIEGMETFPRAIAGRLGSNLRLNCTVVRIVPMRAGKFPVYTVFYEQDGAGMSVEADAVVLATPAAAAAAIIRPIDPETAKTLESVHYPPVAEVFMGFRLEQIGRPLDGFGFLVPAIERRSLLGTIW